MDEEAKKVYDDIYDEILEDVTDLQRRVVDEEVRHLVPAIMMDVAIALLHSSYGTDGVIRAFDVMTIKLRNPDLLPDQIRDILYPNQYNSDNVIPFPKKK